MKKLVLFFLICLFIFSLVGCNKMIMDTTYRFDYAIIQRYEGEQIIKIKSWTDFEDGEQLQILDTDGNVWLVSSFNTILVKGEIPHAN